jgi:DNA polymerase/3'-5' exonuclease PolX
MQYNQAKRLADRILEILQPHCDRIHIAGSIRREKPEVKDIEVVALPKNIAVQDGLFDTKIIQDPMFAELLQLIGARVIKGHADGKYMQIVLRGGDEIKLDLFMPAQDDFYRQLAIRTGSAGYAHQVIAAGWLRKGWCGVSGAGLWMQKDCIKRNDKWILCNPQGQRPPVWQSEEEFFRWIGVPYVHPSDREIRANQLNEAR